LKLVIFGAMFSVWLVWLGYKIVSRIDANVALTEPESTWLDYIRYRIDCRRHPEIDYEPVPRPPFRIGLVTYTFIMLFVILLFATCW